MKHLTIKEKEERLFLKMKNSTGVLSSEFHYKNSMAAPKLQKVVLNTGTGTQMKKDKNKNDAIADRLGKITGQKGALRGAKQSISTFQNPHWRPCRHCGDNAWRQNVRFSGEINKRGYSRTKDFRGINRTAVDNIGNLTIGIKEHTIFPETADEDIRDVFGMSITLVSTAKNKKEGTAFFEILGIPFKKEETTKKK